MAAESTQVPSDAAARAEAWLGRFEEPQGIHRPSTP
jgi:hypothetical protein